MSNLGEWDDDAPTTNEQTSGSDAVQDQVSGALDNLDIATMAGSLVASTVTAEIQRQVKGQVAPIIAKAVAQVLTPERLKALETAAAAAAEAELNPSAGTADEPDEDTAQLYYTNLDEFVREFLMPVYRRRVDEEGRAQLRWSARWWESSEALVRLDAMWRAWERLRQDAATGTSTWFRDHGDYHMGILMSPQGPFAKSKDAAAAGELLPYEAPPKGLFPDERTG